MLCYMPPEQAVGGPVDARSDVYALGAVLHHVLAGAPPRGEGDARALALRAAEGAADDPAAPGIPPELAAIARRAMARRPDDRYPGAAALAEDLRRFLTGRVVDAHRYSAGEVLRRWLRRHRAVTGIAAAALVGVAAVAALSFQNVRAERDRAAAAEAAALAAQGSAEAALVEARAQTAAARLAQARGALASDLAAALTTLADVDLSRETAARAARQVALAAESRGAPARALRGHVRPVEDLVALAGGDVVSVDLAGAVWRWDPAAGRGAQVLDLAEPKLTLAAARDVPTFAAVGERRALVVRADGRTDEIDVSAVPRGLVTAPQYRWELSADGETLAALGEPTFMDFTAPGAPAYLWDLRARPPVVTVVPGERAGQAALRPDGAAVAFETDAGARLFAAGAVTEIPGLDRPLAFGSSGAHLFGFPGGRAPRMVAVTPATGASHELGRWVLATTGDDHVLVVDIDGFPAEASLSLRSLATGAARWTRRVPDSGSLDPWFERGEFDVRVDPRGPGFALRTRDRWHLGDLATGETPRHLDTGPHLRGAWLAGGGFALARHDDLWVWDPPPAPPARARSFAAMSPDGARAVAHAPDLSPVLWDMSTGTPSPSPCLAGLAPDVLAAPATSVAVDGRGRLLIAPGGGAVCLDDRGVVRPLALPAPTRVAIDPEALGLPAPPPALALADRGDGLAVGLADGVVLTWPAPDAPPTRHQLRSSVIALTVLPDAAGAPGEEPPGRRGPPDARPARPRPPDP